MGFCVHNGIEGAYIYLPLSKMENRVEYIYMHIFSWHGCGFRINWQKKEEPKQDQMNLDLWPREKAMQVQSNRKFAIKKPWKAILDHAC